MSNIYSDVDQQFAFIFITASKKVSVFSSVLKTSEFVILSLHSAFSILLRQFVTQLSSWFLSTILIVHVPYPYNAILHMQHFTPTVFISYGYNFRVNRVLYDSFTDFLSATGVHGLYLYTNGSPTTSVVSRSLSTLYWKYETKIYLYNGSLLLLSPLVQFTGYFICIFFRVCVTYCIIILPAMFKFLSLPFPIIL